MMQTLHIFTKDSRRFWLEILIALVLDAAFILVYPDTWRVFEDPVMRSRSLAMVAAVTLLVPASWWLLIARVVHAETLVGDSQFWITRPYEWRKLLASKSIFLTVWICLPYVLGQLVLIAEAGFDPRSYVSVVLFNLCVVCAISILPLFALAAVTANFARLTLTLLGGFAVALLTGFGLSSVLSKGYTSSNPYQDRFTLLLLCCGCIAAIAIQYATRRAWLSRGVLLALPVLLLAIAAAYHAQSLVDRAYPQPGAASPPPIHMTFVPDPNHPVEARAWESEDYIDIPSIHLSGVADGHAIFADDFKFSLTAANGDQWTSPWERIENRFLPGDHTSFLSLQLSPAVYERFKSAPVSLHITYALSRLQADTVLNMTYPSGDVAVPGVGVCYPKTRNTFASLNCRNVEKSSRLTFIAGLWSHVPCSDPASKEKISPGTAWTGRLNSGVDFPLSSVGIDNIWLQTDTDQRHWRICPGSPLTLTQYHLVDRTQSDFVIDGFQLPPIAFRN